MKKLLFFAGLAAMGSVPAFASLVSCATGTDGSGVTNGTVLDLTGTCSAAGSTFSNFVVDAATGFGSGGLTGLSVTVYEDTSNPDNLDFVTTNLGSADIQIYFQASPGVSEISLNGEGENITEYVCSAPVTVGLESCSNSSGVALGGELSTSGTTSESINSATTDYFEKDDSGGSAFEEGFGSTVPEPMTLSMLGIGLLGLGLARRRLRK